MTSHQWCSSGAVLGPVLFNIFINYLDTRVECTINKFADNTKLGGAIVHLQGQEDLKKGLDSLEHWAMINGNEFHEI